MKPKKRTLKFRLVFIYVVTLSLVAFGLIIIAELIVLPKVLNFPRDLYLMGFAAIPNSVIDDTPINSMGFTGDTIRSTTKPKGTIRILTLGGSAFFNKRMTERLKDQLVVACDKKIEVVGAALRTHTTMSSVLKYKFLRKYDFDIVLIYHGINDLWANHIDTRDFKKDYSHLNAWYKRNILLDQSIICRIIYNNVIYHRPPSVLKHKFSDSPGVKVFKQNLTSIIEAVLNDGSIPILMTFAWSIPPNYTEKLFTSNSLGYVNPTNYDRWPVELWGPVAYVSEGLTEHNNIVRELAETHNVFLIDQEKLIGKDLFLFGDVCHLNDDGTERFITNIVSFITANNLC